LRPPGTRKICYGLFRLAVPIPGPGCQPDTARRAGRAGGRPPDRRRGATPRPGGDPVVTTNPH